MGQPPQSRITATTLEISFGLILVKPAFFGNGLALYQQAAGLSLSVRVLVALYLYFGLCRNLISIS